MYAFKIKDGKATDIRRADNKKYIQIDDILVDGVIPENPILAEDGFSLREATTEELAEPLFYSAQQIREMFTDDEMKALMIKAKEDINIELILMKLNTRLTDIAKNDQSLVAAVTYLKSLDLAPQKLIDAVLP